MAASPALAASFAEQSIAAREAAKELKSLAHVIDLVSQAKAFLAGTAPITQDMIIRLSTVEIQAMADSLKTVAEQANLTKQAIREMSIASLGAQLSEASGSGDADRAAALSSLISQQMAAWAVLDAAEKRKSGARPRSAQRDFSEDRMAKNAAASAKRIAAEEIRRSKQSSDIIQKNLELYRAKRLISEGEFNQALLRLSEARAYQAAVATQKELAEIDRRLNDPKITKVARQQLGNARTEALERLKTEQGDAATQVEGDRIDRLKEEAGLISGHRDALAQLNEERRLGLATELESFNLTKEGDPIRLAGLQAQLATAKEFHAKLAQIKSDISANEGNPELQEELKHRLQAVAEASVVAGEAARLQGEQIMAQQRTFEYGWEQAFNKFVADASDGASKAEGIFNTLTQGFNSSLTEFLINPMFKGLLASWGQMLQRMIAEAVAADITNRVFGSATTGGGGKSRTGGWLDLAMAAASAYFGGGTQAAAPVVERSFQAAALLKSADGNAFAGQGAARFAAGGAFGKGEVLTHPTFFRFSQGGSFRTGVAGEAGPEGALPLKRMSNGKLGVFAGGTGGGTTIIQNIHVNGDRAPDLRRAAGQGSREGLAFMANAQRYA
jgi:hypothetical protein